MSRTESSGQRLAKSLQLAEKSGQLADFQLCRDSVANHPRLLQHSVSEGCLLSARYPAASGGNIETRVGQTMDDQHANAGLFDAVDGTRGLYHIGAVAELTGVKAETIRVWERRYGAVQPQRSSGGTRRFSENDVVRLRLLKTLTDRGFSIGAVANLPDDELRAQLVPNTPTSDTPKSIRVAVVHGKLAGRIEDEPTVVSRMSLDVAHRGDTPKAFLGRMPNSKADVVVASLPLLGDTPVLTLESCMRWVDASSAIVLYTFAPKDVLKRLQNAGIKLVQGPLRTQSIVEVVVDYVRLQQLERDSRDDPPRMSLRRYSDSQLEDLREAGIHSDCACPNHLSQLATSLIAFEQYCRSCHRNDEFESAFHDELADGTAQARSIIEELLSRAIEHNSQ
ncbi:MAG: DNA-binding transcriptional MerR regulator [Bradymonadia bacterium]